MLGLILEIQTDVIITKKLFYVKFPIAEFLIFVKLICITSIFFCAFNLANNVLNIYFLSGVIFM